MALASDQDRIKDFWHWLESHEAELRRSGPHSTALRDELLKQLQRYCDDLYFETCLADSTMELVITAHGDVNLFDHVETLIAAAAQIDGWASTALKSPMGFEFETVHGSARIDARSSWFLSLESKTYPSLLGLRLACGDYDPAHHDEYLFAARVVIETGLGERVAARDVHRIEVEGTPTRPEHKGYLKLSALPDLIARRESAKLRA